MIQIVLLVLALLFLIFAGIGRPAAPPNTHWGWAGLACWCAAVLAGHFGALEWPVLVVVLLAVLIAVMLAKR